MVHPAVESEPLEERSLWKRWLVEPIKKQLTQGISVDKIAQAIAFGLTIGIFPIIGATTLLSFLAGMPFRLNQPILQTFQALSSPLQLATILLFYRAGESLYGVPHVSLSIPGMMDHFFEAPGDFLQKYGMTALYGITVWCLIAPFFGALIYYTSRPLIHRVGRGLSTLRLHEH